jgi:predicted DNA-binding protein
MAFSFRLDPVTEASIRRLAKATGRSKSAVVRDAMAQYAAGEIREGKFLMTAFDRLKPFIGVTASQTQGSTDTHAKFKAALARKLRDRRPR